MDRLINQWHTVLDLPKRDLEWHRRNILDEIAEFKEARGLINRWSELSDIVYTYTRAQWSEHEDIEFPLQKPYFYIGLFYMFPKYTLRWKFYRVLGKKFDSSLNISEVRNPMKIAKLKKIAKKYNLDPTRFKSEAERIIRSWVFLK